MSPATHPPTFLRGHWSTEGGGEPILVLTWMEGGTPMSAWVPRATVEAVVAWHRDDLARKKGLCREMVRVQESDDV